jgi:DtxR family Mn-dependent transcriptional regulator
MPARHDARITPAMEDYLKAIYRIEHDGHAVTTQRLADDLDISGASVSNMVKRLNDLNLLVHSPYRGVSLTQTGTAVALEVIRHHRLLELYLSQALGFGIDKVHQEADRLEHHVSEELEARMERALGFPEFDPHGHPIPSRSGMVRTMADVPLTELPAGQPAVVSRVSDRDPAQLRQIDALGVRPGTHISVLSFADDDISIMLGDQERSIPAGMAGLIHVTPVGSAPTS